MKGPRVLRIIRTGHNKFLEEKIFFNEFPPIHPFWDKQTQIRSCFVSDFFGCVWLFMLFANNSCLCPVLFDMFVLCFEYFASFYLFVSVSCFCFVVWVCVSVLLLLSLCKFVFRKLNICIHTQTQSSTHTFTQFCSCSNTNIVCLGSYLIIF